MVQVLMFGAVKDILTNLICVKTDCPYFEPFMMMINIGDNIMTCNEDGNANPYETHIN